MDRTSLSPPITAGQAPKRDIRTDLRGLAGRSVVYGLGQVFVQALGFLLLPLYTRYLSPADYGIISLALVFSAVLAVIYPLGLNAAIARFYFHSSSNEDRRAMTGTLWLTLIASSLLCTLLLELVGPSLTALWFRDFPFDPFLRLSIWAAFFGSFALVPLTLAQIRERARLYVTMTTAQALLTTAIVLWLVVGKRMGAYGYLVGMLSGSALAAPAYLVLTARQVRPAIRKGVLRAGLLYGLPLVPHSLAGWVLHLADRMILERFVSLQEVGWYSLGYQLALPLNVLGVAVNAAWVPFFYRILGEDRAESRFRLEPLTTAFAFVLLAAAGVMVLFGGELVRLMDPSFLPAGGVTPLVVYGYLLSGLYFIPANYLFFRGWNWIVTAASGSAAVLNIVLNLWWVPSFGMYGAALATILAYGAMLAIVAAGARRTFPYRLRYGRIGAGLVLVAFTGLVGTAVVSFLPRLVLPAKLVLLAVCCFALYRLSGLPPAGVLISSMRQDRRYAMGSR